MVTNGYLIHFLRPRKLVWRRMFLNFELNLVDGLLGDDILVTTSVNNYTTDFIFDHKGDIEYVVLRSTSTLAEVNTHPRS